MWIKTLIFVIAGLFSFLSLGMCPSDDNGPHYDYIDPKIETALNVNQVFLVKDKVVITDSFPSFCSDINDKLAKKITLKSNQIFMIVGEFMLSVLDNGFKDGYFKVVLIQEDGLINIQHTGWIHIEDFHEMNGDKIEKVKKNAKVTVNAKVRYDEKQNDISSEGMLFYYTPEHE